MATPQFKPMEEGEGGEEFLFYAERAKTGRAGCKKCKQLIEKGALRMAKVGTNPFGSGTIKMWHHVDCMFEVFARQRATTAKIECVDDIGGWDDLKKEDQEEILSRLPESVKAAGRKKKPSDADKAGTSPKKEVKADHKDNSVRQYRRLLADVAALPGYLDKTAKIREFLTKGSDGESFKGDLGLWIRLLLPGVIKRVYNLQAKQIVKLFCRIFRADQDEMLESLEQGDVAETIRLFFEANQRMKPASKSILTLQDVDRFLDYLSKLTKEDEQISHFESIIPKCTANDLKIIIRLIRHDLRINAGAKHILDAVHPDAYEAFQASRDINSILDKVNSIKTKGDKKNLKIGIAPMVPVLPMLAQPCKSSTEAMNKCPNGMYSEVKYDGERVQVHKNGKQFKYFSRSLKPVLPHKVRTLEEYIPQAFPYGEDLILDSEILMIDTVTGNPLPFGTLGIHKKGEYQNANVCLFVFDCIYYNGKSLLDVPIRERRKILHENMKEIKNRIVFSEMKEIYDKQELEKMMTEVFRLGLEGLVLKDLLSTYEPGKRHWLKVKKDYLFGGAMADSADLVVLGAWYGTGNKGGMMSVFLMGCYDESRRKWCTVTKVHGGHDDETLERLQTELQMEKISRDASKVPPWLHCTKTMIPDFVAKDPKEMPVWEITGAELTKNVVHTADGISVRFPRVTKIRDDKNWETATSLAELKEIYKRSKETADFSLSGMSAVDVSPSKSPKTSPKKRPPGSPLLSIRAPKITKKENDDSDNESKESDNFSLSGMPSVDVSSSKSPKTSPKKRPSVSPIFPTRASKMAENEHKDSDNALPPPKIKKRKKVQEDQKYILKFPLPDVFVGIKLYFPEKISADKKEVLERYFVAYGGELLKKHEKDKATRKITHKEEDLKWLWKSIREQTLST